MYLRSGCALASKNILFRRQKPAKNQENQKKNKKKQILGNSTKISIN